MAFANDASGRVRKAARLALNEMGREWVKLLRWTIDEPYPPASEPGDPPHRRTRTLQRSMKYKVKPHASNAHDLMIFANPETFAKYAPNGYDYSYDLEHGRANLEPRPYFRVVRKQLQPHLQPWFARLFAQYLARMEDANPFDSSDNAADFPAEG